jgi:hypothetical protein
MGWLLCACPLACLIIQRCVCLQTWLHVGARSLACTKRWSDQSLHPPSALCHFLQLDESSWHSGCDVIKGTKWGANYWITLKHVHE